MSQKVIETALEKSLRFFVVVSVCSYHSMKMWSLGIDEDVNSAKQKKLTQIENLELFREEVLELNEICLPRPQTHRP